jgi:serine/threonine-protein kinase ATR
MEEEKRCRFPISLNCLQAPFILIAMLWLPLVRAAEQGTAKPLLRDFMGLNGHTVAFKPELYQPVASLARDYHPVSWDLGNDTTFSTPFPMARNGVDWSRVYGQWKKAGWRTDASLMFETIPRADWKNLAADSRAFAEAFARVFGPSGTNNLVESVEIGNEPGKFDDADYRTIFENMAKGFRAGDPRLRIVTGAMTAGKSHEYAKSLSCIAGLEPLYDVLNVHSYAQLEGWPTWKRSYPEDPALKHYLPDVRDICDWRDAHAPDKEVWITEFGYDSSTQQPDPKTEFKKWIGVTGIQQAQWIVRSWLIFSALPVERAYLFFFNDNDEPHVHGSSGLTRHFHPKPAFYAAAHLQKTLGEYRFNRVVVNRPGDALVYEFTQATNPHRRIWAAWSPTGSERKAKIPLPKIEGSIEHIERMPLSGGENPVITPMPTADSIEIGESPLYLFLHVR